MPNQGLFCGRVIIGTRQLESPRLASIDTRPKSCRTGHQIDVLKTLQYASLILSEQQPYQQGLNKHQVRCFGTSTLQKWSQHQSTGSHKDRKIFLRDSRAQCLQSEARSSTAYQGAVSKQSVAGWADTQPRILIANKGTLSTGYTGLIVHHHKLTLGALIKELRSSEANRCCATTPSTITGGTTGPRQLLTPGLRTVILANHSINRFAGQQIILWWMSAYMYVPLYGGRSGYRRTLNWQLRASTICSMS
jgi:hypothetical protein